MLGKFGTINRSQLTDLVEAIKAIFGVIVGIGTGKWKETLLRLVLGTDRRGMENNISQKEDLDAVKETALSTDLD